ncbi:efflux transporter, outer membrane factor (OMF) lipoprotein, NodT family [Sphingobium sp. AP50]|uniref:efflux transporter outer membrane subunit n=1 Tax=Sphingobium sp. AP50 TaxID=1884369 RepID=UPI0008C5E1A2|nr:efflux transporter outer membrane subunit [Sphingobium sp. AP50]SEJ81838.1 efflux transporter, outer membrane factor (OMF) lipoprotein, NodT family [Sphingobium sp. AP50]
MTKTLFVMLLASASLTACAAGPDYRRPETASSAAKPFLGAGNPSVTADAAVDAQWWRLYNDEVLNGLIVDALRANTDLRVAVARLEKARANLKGAKSDRLPQTNINASLVDQRVPSQQGFVTGRRFWSADLGLDVSYEVDLFGRVKRNVEAARGDWQAAEADRDAVQVAVVSDTVRAYADATASAQQIAVAKETVDLLDRSVRVTGARVDAGRSQRLDLIRITALRNQRQADVAPLEAERDSALFRLATLTGRTPQDLPQSIRDATVLPKIERPIPIGDGAQLIARRPDVRAAERRLAADTARIGVATSDLYPHISLGGQIGTTSAGLSDVFGGGPFRWLLGPLISWSFPNIAATRAKIAGARADTQASLATFDGTVLTALEETETALSAYAHEIDRHQALVAARSEAQRAVNVSMARQKQGTIDFLTVLDAQRTLADARADLAASDARIAFFQVDLFKALGGGWEQKDLATNVASR